MQSRKSNAFVFQIDFFHCSREMDKACDFMVPPAFRNDVLRLNSPDFLRLLGDSRTVIEDVQAQIDKSTRPSVKSHGAFDYEEFHQMPEVGPTVQYLQKCTVIGLISH